MSAHRTAACPLFRLGAFTPLILALAAQPSTAASARLAGSILSVDPEHRELVILDAGKRHMILFSEDTVVREGSHDRPVAELKRGEHVVVTLDEADASRAAIIAVAGPAPAASPGFNLFGSKSRRHAGMPGFANGLNANTQPR